MIRIQSLTMRVVLAAVILAGSGAAWPCLGQPAKDKERLNRQFVDAAWKHDRKRMLELLEQGADINARGINGSFALHLAIGEGSPDAELVKFLLDKGADVNETNDFGETPLITAIRFGSRNSPAVPGIVTMLLEKGADVRASGDKALLAALSGGETAITRLLLDKGADPKAHLADGQTALMLAVQRCSMEAVQALLEKGADPNPNAKDNSGITLLMYAASGGRTDMVRHWLAKGADIKASSKAGETVLMRTSDPATIKLLVAKGADVDATDARGQTALLRSVQQRLSEFGGRKADAALVGALLDVGANIDAQDRDGNTPLLLVAPSWPPNPEVVRLLLKRGAQINHRNKAGQTALELTRESRSRAHETKWAADDFDQVIAELRKAGAAD